MNAYLAHACMYTGGFFYNFKLKFIGFLFRLAYTYVHVQMKFEEQTIISYEKLSFTIESIPANFFLIIIIQFF
jgi:hypothetical protein